MLGYFFSFELEDLTAVVGHMANLFSDLSLLLILIIGVGIGIWVISAIISNVRK